MTKVLILWASADRRRVESLAARLGEDGLSVVWSDAGGPVTPDAAAMDGTAAVLAIWSEAFLRDRGHDERLRAALRMGKLYNLRFDKNAVPRPFRNAPEIQLARWRGQNGYEIDRFAARLVRDLRQERAALLRVRGQRRKLIQGGALIGGALFVLGFLANVTGLMDWTTDQSAAAGVSADIQDINAKIDSIASSLKPPDPSHDDARRLGVVSASLSSAGLPSDRIALALASAGTLENALKLMTTEFRAEEVHLSPHERRMILHQIGALLVDSDPQSAINVYREIVDLAPSDLEAHERLGYALHLTSDVDAALQEYEFVISAARPGSYGQTEAMMRKASILRSKSRLNEAIDLFLQVILTSETMDYPDLTSRATTRVAMLLVAQGQSDEAAELAADILPLQLEKRYDHDRAATLGILGSIAKSEGKLNEALELQLQGLKLEREIGNVADLIYAIEDVVHTLLALKRTQEAESLAFEAVAIARSSGQQWGTWRASITLAEVLLAQSRKQEACTALRIANDHQPHAMTPSPDTQARIEALGCFELGESPGTTSGGLHSTSP